MLPEAKVENIEMSSGEKTNRNGTDLLEETISTEEISVSSGSSVDAGETASKKESIGAQPLNTKVQNDGIFSGGGQEEKVPEAPSIFQNSTGESNLSYDLAGRSGEVGATVSLQTDSVSSKDAFLNRLSQALKNQMISKSGLVAQNGRAEIRLELKPEYMGKLFLRLSLENGTINAKFLVENQQVRNLIENNMPQLKQSLADQGISWQEASVDVGGSGSGLFHEDSDRGTRKWASQYSPSGEELPEFCWGVVSNDGLQGTSISYLA